MTQNASNALAMNLVFTIKSMVDHGGGAERVLADVVNGLVARGHTVTIVTFDRPGDPYFYDLDDRVIRCGLDISAPGRATPRMALPKGMCALRHMVRRTRPDVVVGFMHSSYVPVAFALTGLGVPVVASEHADARHFQTRPAQELVRRMALALSAEMTVPSDAVRLTETGRSPDRIVTISNPITLPQDAVPSVDTDSRTLLAVGGLRAEKGFDTLISAFAALAPSFPDWRLRIVGDGILRPQIEAQIANSGLVDRIEMSGMLRNVSPAYSDAALVVVSSDYESFGIVAAEALAHARPVVAFTDCLGVAAMLRDGENGLLANPTDYSDRAAALIAPLARLMGDAALRVRLGDAGPASVAHFAPITVIDRWEQLLWSVAKSRCNCSPV